MYRGCFILDATDVQELDCESPCDISLDPEDGTLSLVNSEEFSQSFFLTIANVESILDNEGFDMLAHNRKTWGLDYVTIVALVAPRTIFHACTIEVGEGDVKIQSDIQKYIACNKSEDFFPLEIFPLLSDSKNFLCTQAEGGLLTHFAHPSTFYAVDFQCDVGTPIVSVCDGEVVEIRNSAVAGSPEVCNFFDWNAIMIKSADFCIEYVHVLKDSFQVSVGDKVAKGQVICASGGSGFCPEPHLHFEVHRDSTPGSVSVPIRYRGESFQTGAYYGQTP